jgi:hypothetical protein
MYSIYSIYHRMKFPQHRLLEPTDCRSLTVPQELVHHRPVPENAIQHRLGNLHKCRRGHTFPLMSHDPLAGMHNFCDVAWARSHSKSNPFACSGIRSRPSGENNGRRTAATALSVSHTRSVAQLRTSIDVPAILRGAGLTLFELTKAEADCASETPDITWGAFARLFGGRTRTERPDCHKIPEYKNFLCTTIVAQPYTPTLPGQPGLVLRIPTTVSTPPDDYSNPLYVLSCPVIGSRLQYLGEYTRRPLPDVQIRWCDLSHDVRTFPCWCF